MLYGVALVNHFKLVWTVNKVNIGTDKSSLIKIVQKLSLIYLIRNESISSKSNNGIFIKIVNNDFKQTCECFHRKKPLILTPRHCTGAEMLKTYVRTVFEVGPSLRIRGHNIQTGRFRWHYW